MVPPLSYFNYRQFFFFFDIPDGENTTSFGEIRFFLDATDSLLENRGDLSGRCLCVDVGSGLYRSSVEDCWCGISCL